MSASEPVPAAEPESAAAAHAEGLEENVNYQYFLDLVRRRAAGHSAFRVLDFGCGHGYLVRMLRDAGIDAYGCDVFYEGADWNDPVLSSLRSDEKVKEIVDGEVPFGDGFFDLVITNQVFEHVEEIEPVVGELHRVLRATGSAYHHFPSREVVREGHIGIPMAHWMKPGRLRTTYVLTLRRLGFGKFKQENPTPREWTDAKLEWIDTYCFYRPYSQLQRQLGAGFTLEHHEIDYCRFRAGGEGALGKLMNVSFLRRPLEAMFRRLAFMAIEQRRV